MPVEEDPVRICYPRHLKLVAIVPWAFNTPFVVRENTTNVIKALEDIGENLIKWFSDNQMKLNTDKCHVLLNSKGPKTIKIGNLWRKISSCK